MTNSKPMHPTWSAPWVHRNIQAAVLILSCSFAPAQAQSFNELCELYRSLLMAPERALIGTFRQLQRIAKPVIGPNNTRGRWIQRDVFLGHEAFNTTFYLKGGVVHRIELESSASDAQCRAQSPWSNAITALEAWNDSVPVKGQYDTGDTIQQTVYWTAGDADVTAYLSIQADACSTKVAFKKRETKDASEL